MASVVGVFFGCGENEPVEFYDLRVDELTARRAVVKGETSRPTTCRVDFGTSMMMLDRSASDPNMADGQSAIDHEVPLEDLTPDTMMFWQARAVDEDGEVYLSEVMSFRTPAEPSDMNQQPGNMLPEPVVMQNVALLSMGSSVPMVSSNFGGATNDASWGIHNALDGQMSTEWSSNGDGDDAWMMLDFGKMRKIERFGFRSRKMTDGSSIITSVRLIFDGTTTMGPFDTPNPDERYEFDITPTQASQVRVEAVTTTGGNTGAKEIEFFEAMP